MGSAAGPLRTCAYLSAMATSSACAAFFEHGAHTDGPHHPALSMAGGTVPLATATPLAHALPKTAPGTGRR
ncbi:hypothetical protein [Streptomyces sp. RPT161]|uniref:hypothetical protein n=1 Tax=Streptomyces sp. RPT161 TaxID=3015993 RepID=UPI0022B878B5|nr:hypothetical protein [Streptomyces sp. RPT161]